MLCLVMFFCKSSVIENSVHEVPMLVLKEQKLSQRRSVLQSSSVNIAFILSVHTPFHKHTSKSQFFSLISTPCALSKFFISVFRLIQTIWHHLLRLPLLHLCSCGHIIPLPTKACISIRPHQLIPPLPFHCRILKISMSFLKFAFRFVHEKERTITSLRSQGNRAFRCSVHRLLLH